MKEKKLSLVKIGLAVATFLLLAIVRLHDYDRTPTPNHAEELLYGWSGIHLIETGVPVSWSTLDYPKENLVFDGIVGDKDNLYLPAKLYKPWLDEPPLYSLLAGGAAHLYNADRNQVLPPAYTRIPSVAASLFVLGLVFIVGWQFFNYSTGWLAMLIYGVSPIMVFGSRLSVPENIMALGTILAIWMAQKYLVRPQIKYALIFGIMSAVLGLMKPTGFFLAPLMIFLAGSKKRWKDGAIIGVTTLLGVGAFLAYGYYFGWEVFETIVSIQGQRFAGWTGLTHILTTPAYDISEFMDGWYLFGLIFTLVIALKKKKTDGEKLLSLFSFYWLMVALLGGTEGDLLPWYRYPIFPLIAINGAVGLRSIYKKPSFYGMVLVVGLLMTSRYHLSNAFRPTTPPNMFRAIVLIALAPSLIDLAWKQKWARSISRAIVILFVAMGSFLSYKYIYSAFPIRCESIECAFGPSTRWSEIRLPFFWRFIVPKDSTGMLTTKRPLF